MTKIIILLSSFLLASCDFGSDNSTGKHCKVLSVESIKNKANKSYGDYIQLAVLYAKDNASPDTIEYWLKESINLNPSKSCKMINFLQNDSAYITRKYGDKIDEVLKFCQNRCALNSDSLYTKMDYYPEQKDGVSEEKYRKATHILKNTYEQIKGDNNTITYADHLNLATAFRMLKEPREQVLYHLNKAQEKDMESTAEVFLIISKKENYEGYLSSLEYDSVHNKFTKIVEAIKKDELDIEAYAREGGYDIGLVSLLARLKENDQKFRQHGKEDFEKQNMLDSENILIIDSLYNQYKKYVGRSFVGDQFDYVMWAVIQHADLEDQEKYLPVVYNGMKLNELGEGSFKMLLDRIYLRKYGYQIFGSQAGGALGTEEEIQKVKDLYGL